MRTLRLFPDHERARTALHTRVPPGARVYETQMKWVLEHGNEVWFRTVDAELRGIEWNFIAYDEAGTLDGETVARASNLISDCRPETKHHERSQRAIAPLPTLDLGGTRRLPRLRLHH